MLLHEYHMGTAIVIDYLMSCPLHLPVVWTPSQGLSAQHLPPEQEAVRVHGCIHHFCPQGGLAIPIRDKDVAVGCVLIQCGFKSV